MANGHSTLPSWRDDPEWNGVRLDIWIRSKHIDLLHSLMAFYQCDDYQELFEELLGLHDLYQELMADLRRQAAGAEGLDSAAQDVAL